MKIYAYRDRCITRLNEAVQDDPDEFYLGNVKFNTIVNDAYITTLDNIYDIKFLDLKLRGNGTKSGKATTVDRWPKDSGWLSAQQNFVRTELQDPDFTIELGNIAAKVWAKASILQNVRNNENSVFNIDIGPYDILKEFLTYFPRERLILFSGDIAWEKGL